MMTFEEFFKKKKIDLDKFKVAEAALFVEFKDHYAQMGEKSFDYTKKYWFNELRRKYHTPAEQKVEKIKSENQIAEQTVTDSLTSKPNTEPAQGYTPKFRASIAGTAPKPNEEQPVLKEEFVETVKDADVPTPKLGFKPKFKTATPQATQPEEKQSVLDAGNTETPTTDESIAPKLGFKPKFKAANPPIVTPDEPSALSSENIEVPKVEELSAPKLGFKPKFRAAIPVKNDEIIKQESDQPPKAPEGDK